MESSNKAPSNRLVSKTEAKDSRNWEKNDAGPDIGSEEFKRKISEDKRKWATTSDRTVFWASGDVADILPPGLYRTFVSNETGPGFRKMLINTDDLVVTESPMLNFVIEQIRLFWSPETKEKFRKYGFLYKRGVLMYGEPGVGKTASIQILIKKLIEDGGIAIFSDDPAILTQCLQLLRRIEPNKPVIVILEDFDTLTDRERRENEWLSIMDGEAQIDNVVFIATTNYVEKLDKRFTDRPSRFDLIVPVSPPMALERAVFLRQKIADLDLDDIRQWVTATKGFSIAHLKELIISVKVFDRDFKGEIDRMTKMKERKFSNEEFKDQISSSKSTGFGFGRREEEDPNEYVNWDEFEKTFMVIKPIGELAE